MIHILIIGSGSREHALAWKIRQSSLCGDLYIAPGNAGTSSLGTNIPVSVNDFSRLADCCIEHGISLVMVGPEEPLVNGIVDFFEADPRLSHISIIGPNSAAARLEGSKDFAKSFMLRNRIPTAVARSFRINDFDEGIAYIRNHSLPVVLKADGLAAGKGVLICQQHEEAVAAFTDMLRDGKFGSAANTVVVESFLSGTELSIFLLSDGTNFVMLPAAKDYKRIGEGDTGLNTGGMGAVSPVPVADEPFLKKVEECIARPTVEGLRKEGLIYRGIIFLGLIRVGDEPYVIEYNCRLGDPETAVVLPRVENDWVELMLAVSHKQIHEVRLRVAKDAAATIVAVSGGYPGAYENGKTVFGLGTENPAGKTIIFHSGTRLDNSGRVLTNGGRVLAVTSLAPTLLKAVNESKALLEKISFDGMYFRRDIGFEFL
jgi:phosphoribosylamine--glycine ligase